MIIMSFIFSQKSPKLCGVACKIGKSSQNWRRGARQIAKMAPWRSNKRQIGAGVLENVIGIVYNRYTLISRKKISKILFPAWGQEIDHCVLLLF